MSRTGRREGPLVQGRVIYELDVETYQDSDGDGIGDFRGLEGRLDHLVQLGVDCVWLNPFFPTPNRDNGYDVVDHYGIDPRLGSAGDFVEFMVAADRRGIRVLIDLVVNHTSSEHPWFRAARSDPGSRTRDFVFPGVQESTWTYDRKAKEYYFHRFYEHQPELNIANPSVREEIRRIMGFWLELGVSGFRVDAAPFLIELKGIDDPRVRDPYRYLKEFRDFLSWRRGDAILLAEANVAMDQVREYFGDGDKLHMLFDFMLNQHLFLALARERARPLVEGMHRPPEIPATGQWANFLRNHDELDLGRLTEAQRSEVFADFAPEERMRLYDRGIRRRLPPMLGGDDRRLRMAYSLLLTLPGTPIVRYGEEIGMGDDLSLEGRNSVRTPMQWSGRPNGGFSTASADDLVRPVVDDGDYGYEKVNVERARQDPGSLLRWMERAIRMRRSITAFGRGDWRIVDVGPPEVFAHLVEHDGERILAVHNLTDEPRTAILDVSEDPAGVAVDVLEPGSPRRVEGGTLEVELDRYGFRWLRIESER